MTEAIADLCTPKQLRSLFVILVSEGAAANILFERFSEYMRKDYTLHRKLSDNQALDELLYDLQSALEACGKSMESVGLPSPQGVSPETYRHLQMFDEQKCYTEYLANFHQLNAEQTEFFDTVQKKIDCNEPGLLFLDGPAGTQYI